MRIKSALARRCAAVALSVVGAGALVTGVSSPASAETLNGNCESGEVCLWYFTNYNGAIADIYESNANYSGWHFYNSSYWLNDNTRSAKSKSIWTWACVSEHANYGGTLFFSGAVNQGDENDFGAYNDRGSSHRFLLICNETG